MVEDEPAVAEIVSTALAARGYRVEVSASGGDALRCASLDEPDIVILDLGLPDIDGVEVCRQLRRWFANPIIVLSADGAEDRKVAALDEGADDYVTKPFSMPELLARLRVAVRHRLMVGSTVDPAVLSAGDVVVDTGAYSVRVGGQVVAMTRRELGLLAALLRQPGRVLTHRVLLERVWRSSPATASLESLRVHVAQLRKKLGSGPERPRIVTEPGIGYRLLAPED